MAVGLGEAAVLRGWETGRADRTKLGVTLQSEVEMGPVKCMAYEFGSCRSWSLRLHALHSPLSLPPTTLPHLCLALPPTGAHGCIVAGGWCTADWWGDCLPGTAHGKGSAQGLKGAGGTGAGV